MIFEKNGGVDCTFFTTMNNENLILTFADFFEQRFLWLMIAYALYDETMCYLKLLLVCSKLFKWLYTNYYWLF